MASARGEGEEGRGKREEGRGKREEGRALISDVIQIVTAFSLSEVR
jgi:hypothetical protein